MARLPVLRSFVVGLVLASLAAPLAAHAGERPSAPAPASRDEVERDEPERIIVEIEAESIQVAIELMEAVSGKRFVYGDEVQAIVTIVTAPVTHRQAYEAFEAALRAKGFTFVEGPGGAVQVIRARDAIESNAEEIADLPSLMLGGD